MASALQVAVRKQRAGFTLEAAFEAPVPGVTALFGRSGSGKTTLVNLIAGLLQPEEGSVRLGDEVLTDTQRHLALPVERRGIGYVFQDARLFPHLTVAGNLAYGARRTRAAPFIGFEEVVTLLGLAHLLQRRPGQLSGGEQQRVALGRALLSQPRLLLLDEPLASLDAARRADVLPYLERLRDRLAIPMVYVSHQFEEVLRLADFLVLLERGQVLAQGTPQALCLRPELQALVGPEHVGALLEGTVRAVDAGGARVEVAGNTLHLAQEGLAVGARVRVQLLARDLILANQPVAGVSVRNVLKGTVIGCAPDPYGAVLVACEVAGERVLSRITAEAQAALALNPGQPVWILVKAAALRAHARPPHEG